MDTPNSKSEELGTAEAARELNKPLRTVQNWIVAKRLPARLLCGVYLIKRGDLEAFKAELQAEKQQNK